MADLYEMLRQLREYLLIDYIFSDEHDRIRNPKRDDTKYEKLIQALVTCGDVFRDTEGKVNVTDPDFPCSNHIITVHFDELNDVTFVDEAKRKLSNVINNCDEFVITGDKQGKVDIIIGFNDIYTDKGKS